MCFQTLCCSLSRPRPQVCYKFASPALHIPMTWNQKHMSLYLCISVHTDLCSFFNDPAVMSSHCCLPLFTPMVYALHASYQLEMHWPLTASHTKPTSLMKLGGLLVSCLSEGLFQAFDLKCICEEERQAAWRGGDTRHFHSLYSVTHPLPASQPSTTL